MATAGSLLALCPPEAAWAVPTSCRPVPEPAPEPWSVSG
jgi:hypothetical protein